MVVAIAFLVVLSKDSDPIGLCSTAESYSFRGSISLVAVSI
jgi:hypothetical protein